MSGAVSDDNDGDDAVDVQQFLAGELPEKSRAGQQKVEGRRLPIGFGVEGRRRIEEYNTKLLKS